jgi:hypothetical protein
MRRCAALAVALGLAVSASAQQTPVTPAPAQKPPAGAVPASTPAPAPAAAKFSQQELDQLLAPIALYPDALLAQVLMASTYPLDVVSAERWVKANPGLKDKALQDALAKQPWDPSVKSLAVFPQVLTMMSEQLDWTQKLGDAFLAQQKEVLATAQSLRAKAQAQGNLKDTAEQKVATTQEGSTTVIRIEPTNPEVVYVPTYNPTVVYGSWWWPAYPPYYYYPPGYVAGGALLGFTAGVIVGGALWGNANWGGGDVNIDIDRYNNFNKTNISNKEWSHNAERRGAVPYRDSATAQQYGKGRSADAASREAFQGRAESGRQSIQRGEVSTSDLGAAFRGSGGAADARDAGSRGASAGTRDLGAGAGSRDYGASAGARDLGVSASARDYSGTRGGNAFDSRYSGAQARDYGSRGASSMSASRSAGNMSASRPAGGGARAGGGGGGRGGRR